MESSQIEAIKQEIDELVINDQAMRNGMVWDVEVDTVNTNKVKKIIEQVGWLVPSVFGQDVSVGAWLLVQHADDDPEFQQQCLDLLKSLPIAETNPRLIAYLEDRIRVNAHQSQVYGTQIYYTDGQYQKYEIEDISHLDQRRAAMNLGPFEEYLDYIKDPAATFDGYFDLLDNK